MHDYVPAFREDCPRTGLTGGVRLRQLGEVEVVDSIGIGEEVVGGNERSARVARPFGGGGGLSRAGEAANKREGGATVECEGGHEKPKCEREGVESLTPPLYPMSGKFTNIVDVRKNTWVFYYGFICACICRVIAALVLTRTKLLRL